MGSSAGSLLACPSIEYVEYLDDKSKAGGLTDFRGLGIVDFSLLVHWGSKFNPEGRLKTLKESNRSDEWHKLVILNDWQYVKVVGDMYRVVDIKD